MSVDDSNVTHSAAEWEAFAGALRRAALAVSDARGDGVLGELVAALADILAVDAAFIAVQEDDAPASLHRRIMACAACPWHGKC